MKDKKNETVEKTGQATSETADHKSTDLPNPGSKGKGNGQQAAKTVSPQLLEVQPDEQEHDLSLFSDSTAVVEYSLMQNAKYSEEIISHMKNIYNIDKLQELKGDRFAYLHEARYQIITLFNGIHALNIHNEMYTVLSLIGVGGLLNTIKGEFESPHEFAKWRNDNFDVKHQRYLQNAAQLAAMGEFSRKFSPLGKTRLLQLEHIRKAEKMASCEDLLRECQIYDEIELRVLPDEAVKNMGVDPFPDASCDIDNELIKHHVDSVITYKRLKKMGISYVNFEQAQLIASHFQKALLVEDAEKVKEYLNKHNEADRPDVFDSLIMDAMKPLSLKSPTKGSGFSLNKVVSDLLRFCKGKNFDDHAWLEKQMEVVDEDLVLQAVNYLNLITTKMGFNTQNINGEA